MTLDATHARKVIRVTRVLEYTYQSLRDLELDQEHWFVAPNGRRDLPSVVIKSHMQPVVDIVEEEKE
jgi:hypothetical protein